MMREREISYSSILNTIVVVDMTVAMNDIDIVQPWARIVSLAS